jgi:hypothetical protein
VTAKRYARLFDGSDVASRVHEAQGTIELV